MMKMMMSMTRTSLRCDRALARSLCASLAALAVQAATAAPPQRLACRPEPGQLFAIGLDASGSPQALSVQTSAGSRECELRSRGRPTKIDADRDDVGSAGADSGSGWRFEWQDELLATHYRAQLRALGQGAFELALDPAQCNGLALPARLSLDPRISGCRMEPDRDAAFRQFWADLRDSMARKDGAALQGLALAKLAFAEGPDSVTASSRLLARGLPCLAVLPLAKKPGRQLRHLLAERPELELSSPELRQDNPDQVDIGGVLGLRWLAQQGWRLDWINASRSVLAECRSDAPAS